MSELAVIVVLIELLIISSCVSLWLGVKYFYYRRRQKNAVQLIQHTWQKQEHLYGEVLRKRLSILYKVEGEALGKMVDAVQERERQLVRQFNVCLARPEAKHLTDLLHFINRHGDIYAQLASKKAE